MLFKCFNIVGIRWSFGSGSQWWSEREQEADKRQYWDRRIKLVAEEVRVQEIYEKDFMFVYLLID